MDNIKLTIANDITFALRSHGVPVPPLDNRQHIDIVISVPIDDIDMSKCDCAEFSDTHEIAGVRVEDITYGCDLSAATYRGETIVEFVDNDAAEEELIRREYG